MKIVVRVSVLMGLLLSVSLGAQQQTRSDKLPNSGKKIVFRVPATAGILKKENGFSYMEMVLAIDSVAGLTVNGTDRWLFRESVPKTYKMGPVRRDKKRREQLVFLFATEQGGDDIFVVLPFDDASAVEVFNDALFDRKDPGRTDRAAVQRLKESAFPTDLRSSLDVSVREMLVATVRKLHGIPAFSVSTFKDAKYFNVGLGPVGNYNEAKLTANQRASMVVTEVLLPSLRRFVPLLATVPSDGIQFDMRVNHQNFVTSGAISADEWHVYLPYTAIKKFLDADITSQDLIDQSIVLIDSNRTKIVLSEG